MTCLEAKIELTQEKPRVLPWLGMVIEAVTMTAIAGFLVLLIA